ncbi:hypothetical protein [Paenibacillus sp. FSL R7-0337]|uniref:hypothetical protein n=1 Tax=Paenibacillus sp. FSL R7-0337 TaxID=1926588 RepID=UPI00096C475D|nr:hypothetical protein [Paenibacillus sp. FSL R7-0337]OMF98173.1 hypothetical protein BK147_11165 [Paenibacillus sp. FSL R7-0337]
MASSAYDQSIRNSLVSKGVDNSKIGYNNGYVTIDGNNFQKADKNYNGTAFTNANNFNNAWNAYSQSQSKATAPAAASPATAPSGMVGVRNSLQSSGYDPNSIGYNNGMVTVNNQPFVTPSANVGGSAYVSPSTYNSALGNYRINDLTNQVVNNTKLPDNTYTPQIDQLIQQLQGLSKNQQTVDPYSTPEYTAYQAQADRRSQKGIRAAQESLGSSGFGRSTALGERSQGIQNEQTEYLETQVIPQIIAANQAKQQQEYQNLYNLLTPLMSQQGYADNRSQTELGNVINALGAVTSEQQRGYDNRRADAALTGNYLTPDQQNAIDTLLGLKQQAESPTITRQQRAALSSQADTIRSQLQALGLDPTALGANVSAADASKASIGRTLAGQQLDQQASQQQWENRFNYGQAIGQFANGQKTLQAEQLAYQKARDAIADKQWQAKFDEDVRQYGLGYGLQQLSQSDDAAYRQAQLALSQDDNARQWVQLDYQQSQPGAGQKYVGMSANQVLDNIKALYTEPVMVQDPDYPNNPNALKKSGEQLTKDPTKRTEMFEAVVDAGLSEAETKQVLLGLGYTMKDIEARIKQYSGN